MRKPVWSIASTVLAAAALLACGSTPASGPSGGSMSAPSPSTGATAPSPDGTETTGQDIAAGDAGGTSDATAIGEVATPADPVPEPEPEPEVDTCADVSSEMQDRLMPLWDACYQKAKKKNRSAGPAEMQIWVDDAGKIEKVAYQGTTGWGPKVAQCMIDATKTIAFDGTACAGRMITARKEYRGEL